MDDRQPRVSLRKTKSQSWTDPVTGEIYPGGNPNEVPQPEPQSNFAQPQPQQISQNNFAQPQQNFSQNISVIPSSNIEVYPNTNVPQALQPGMKYCKYCGQQIPMEAVLCVKCGRQVEQLQGMQNVNPQVIINNAPPAVIQTGRPKDKWVAVFLRQTFFACSSGKSSVSAIEFITKTSQPRGFYTQNQTALENPRAV